MHGILFALFIFTTRQTCFLPALFNLFIQSRTSKLYISVPGNSPVAVVITPPSSGLFDINGPEELACPLMPNIGGNQTLEYTVNVRHVLFSKVVICRVDEVPLLVRKYLPSFLCLLFQFVPPTEHDKNGGNFRDIVTLHTRDGATQLKLYALK